MTHLVYSIIGRNLREKCFKLFRAINLNDNNNSLFININKQQYAITHNLCYHLMLSMTFIWTSIHQLLLLPYHIAEHKQIQKKKLFKTS